MRCEVWGSPIEHSLSPVLHRAAYAALGLDWQYERREVDESTFAAQLAGLGPEVRGLSLTMPLKECAYAAASRRDDHAEATGAVNTLVREGDSWVGSNTDVHGIEEAFAEAIGKPLTLQHALVVGSGATGRSALAAVVAMGARRVTFMVRSRVRPETLEQAEESGVEVASVAPGEWGSVEGRVGALVSTVPPASVPVEGIDVLRGERRPGPAVLDAVYGDGGTPLLAAAREHGWPSSDGTRMLLHQAVLQVVHMTSPETDGTDVAARVLGAMDEALWTATGRPRPTV